MADRAPLPSVAGMLSGHVGRDLPIGVPTIDTTLEEVFVGQIDPSSIGDTVVELRDATSALATVTVPMGSISGTTVPGTPVAIPSGTDLYLRITQTASDSLGLWGWWGKLDAGSAQPPSGLDLTTLARVKRYLSIAGGESDEILQEIITAVSVAMRHQVGQDPSTAVVTAEPHSQRRWSPELQLFRWPAQSVQEVRVDGAALDPGAYQIESELGRLIYGTTAGSYTSWPCGYRRVEVDYTVGFSVVPDDMQHAATIQTAWDYKRTGAKGGRLGERSTIVGDATATYMVDAWAPEVERCLNRYRAAWVA